MSNEINEHRQCQTCSVCFLTSGELRDHLQVYRTQEHILNAKLQECRAHLSPLDSESDIDISIDNEHTGGDAHDSTFPRSKTAEARYCPHEECSREKPFVKPNKLVRHFAIHIQCHEVCVYCFKFYNQASQYIAHANTHKEVADMTKKSYTRQICDQLKQNAADALQNCQNNKKRTREPAGTTGDRRVRAKLDVEGTITSSPSHFHSLVNNPLPYVKTLDEGYGAAIFHAVTFPSNIMAEQFRGEIGDIQTSIMDPFSDLGGSTIPKLVQEGYTFRHAHNRADEYHGQS